MTGPYRTSARGDDWVEPKIAAKMLGVTKQRISQLLRTGELTGEKDAEGRFRIWRDSVEALRSYRSDTAARTTAERAARESQRAEAAEQARIDRMRRQKELAAKEAEEKDFRYRVLGALESIAGTLKKVAKEL